MLPVWSGCMSQTESCTLIIVRVWSVGGGGGRGVVGGPGCVSGAAGYSPELLEQRGVC